MDAYSPGKSKAFGHDRPVKLSSNENPLGTSPRALAAMRDSLGTTHRYPDGGCHDLRAALGQRFDLDPNHIVCGAGSDEILQLLPLIYSAPGDEILHVRHGFAIYPISARRVGATPVAAPDRDYVADVDALLAAVTPRTKILFLANPNNPTGTVLLRSDLERLHAGLREDILLVIDSAYAEYVDNPDYEDGRALVQGRRNVIMTRTFSKIYGLAAERIGWAYGSLAMIAALNKVRGPFNVTRAGMAGALAALADQDWVEESRAHNRHWRDWLVQDMRDALGDKVQIVPSAANFILAFFPQNGPWRAEVLHHGLARRGYLVRWLPEQGLPDALRISVGTADEMRGFGKALRACLEDAE